MFGGNTRVLMQFSDDSLEVYYVLEILNTARARVDIGGPLTLDLPQGALGATALEGSSPSATVSTRRSSSPGRSRPARRWCRSAFRMPYNSVGADARADLAGRAAAGHRRRREGERPVDRVAAVRDGQRRAPRTGATCSCWGAARRCRPAARRW